MRSIYPRVERSLFKSFKANNKALVNVLIITLIFLQPLVLLFNLLPGYFVLQGDFLSAPFWLAVFLLGFCSYCTSAIYHHVVAPKYYSWIVLLAGKKRFLIRYCWAQFKFAVPTWLFMFIGFVYSELNFKTISVLLAVIALHLVFYLFLARHTLQKVGSNKAYQSVTGLLAISFIKSVLLHLLLYGFLMMLLLTTLAFIPHFNTKLILAICLGGGLVVLLVTIAKIMMGNLRIHRSFLILIHPKLYTSVRASIGVAVGVLIIIPIFSGFWLDV
ncbi:MAG: hypothetical protein GJ680_13340 [Alteromonadaceae bacterium]|nr:hypothetical protein [Alteromonadaceae bacterium]